jgi:hypothetical protein
MTSAMTSAMTTVYLSAALKRAAINEGVENGYIKIERTQKRKI